MKMSENQKENLAWVIRVVQMSLLGIASLVGYSVYNKVDEMYSNYKVQTEINLHFKEQLEKLSSQVDELRMQRLHDREQYFTESNKRRFMNADR